MATNLLDAIADHIAGRHPLAVRRTVVRNYFVPGTPLTSAYSLEVADRVLGAAFLDGSTARLIVDGVLSDYRRLGGRHSFDLALASELEALDESLGVIIRCWELARE